MPITAWYVGGKITHTVEVYGLITAMYTLNYQPSSDVNKWVCAMRLCAFPSRWPHEALAACPLIMVVP
eukprot:353796-Chlamydomonas_euryale.AAC.8